MKPEVPKNQPSIRARIKRISVFSNIALAFILGLLTLTSFYIYQNMDKAIQLQDDLHIMQKTDSTLLEITMTSMDIIVDRADGQVDAKRIEFFSESFKDLNENLFPQIEKIYHRSDEAEKFSRITKLSRQLQDAAANRLVAAVRAYAPQTAFDALDDEIDSTAETIRDELSEIILKLDSEVGNSFATTQSRSLLLVFGNIMILALASMALALLVRYIQNIVVTPMSNITNVTIDTILTSANKLQNTTSQLDKLMLNVAAATDQGSKKAFQITSGIENVAAAIEELASSISEIRRQANISNEVSGLAVKESNSMGETIHQLNNATDGIGEITELINKIAESTNLLALNATIEAARAGDAGKGFAVVATEVKNLAVKTAEATSDISRKITEMQEMSKLAVAAIGNIQETISEINTANTNVMASVEQQSSATNEITRTLNDATDGLRITSQSIADINVSIHETKRNSDIVMTATQDLLSVADKAKEDSSILINGKKAA